MPLCDRQRFIIEIVAEAINQPAETRRTFAWLCNRHTEKDFGSQYPVIERIYTELRGDNRRGFRKRVVALHCDAYFGGAWNFMLEFDEFQHFSSARAKALDLLPDGLSLGFSLSDYKRLCHAYDQRADKYRRDKRTRDFDFIGGRTAQRAYFDASKDLLPVLHGLRPTIRISEFEVEHIRDNDVEARSFLRALVERKMDPDV